MSWLENATPSSVGQGLWLILRTLRTSTLTGASRLVRTSGSGTGGVYSQSGDVITEAVLSNALAWFVLRGRPFTDAGVISYREWCVQVDGLGGIRVTYSPRLGFVMGSPDKDRTPTAGDVVPIFGGGTDASPTFENVLPAPGHRYQGFAHEYDDRFWFMAYPVGGGPAQFLWFLDLPTTPPPKDGGSLRDPDPAVHYGASGASCALDLSLSRESTAPRSAFSYGTTDFLWGRCPVLSRYVFDSGGVLRRVFPAGVSTSLVWSVPSYPEDPFRYARRAGVSGSLLAGEVGNPNTTDDKGSSHSISWAGREYSVPELLDSVDPTSGEVSRGSALAVGHVMLDWSGTPLIL